MKNSKSKKEKVDKGTIDIRVMFGNKTSNITSPSISKKENLHDKDIKMEEKLYEKTNLLESNKKLRKAHEL